jgi:hypothetical protein
LDASGFYNEIDDRALIGYERIEIAKIEKELGITEPYTPKQKGAKKRPPMNTFCKNGQCLSVILKEG